MYWEVGKLQIISRDSSNRDSSQGSSIACKDFLDSSSGVFPILSIRYLGMALQGLTQATVRAVVRVSFSARGAPLEGPQWA